MIAALEQLRSENLQPRSTGPSSPTGSRTPFVKNGNAVDRADRRLRGLLRADGGLDRERPHRGRLARPRRSQPRPAADGDPRPRRHRLRQRRTPSTSRRTRGSSRRSSGTMATPWRAAVAAAAASRRRRAAGAPAPAARARMQAGFKTSGIARRHTTRIGGSTWPDDAGRTCTSSSSRRARSSRTTSPRAPSTAT